MANGTTQKPASAWDVPVGNLHGVGRVKAAAYEKLGISTLGDLALHFPRAYENRGDVKLLSAAVPEMKNALLLTVATEPSVHTVRRGMSLLKFRAFDDSGVCEITYFNQNYKKEQFRVGDTFRFWGKVERVGKRYAMTSPAAELYDENTPLPPLVAVYPLSEGLSQKQIAENMTGTLPLLSTAEDPLPPEIRSARGLCTRQSALAGIHFPATYEAVEMAKKRLIYDEFFTFSLGMSASHARTVCHGAPVCNAADLSHFSALLPYTLTGAQQSAIREIAADMACDVPMSRIVIGDVGCGKTMCAVAAMLIAVQSGHQAALMAPTEILARQHYSELKSYFDALGITCELLVGATPAVRKKAIRARLSDSTLQAVIGTQALLSEGVEFASVGVVVTDEQHRFGVRQRARLSEKGGYPHLLVMSATPIPRSLALVLYGDLSVSRIDEMPPGRQRVDTYTVNEAYRPRIDAFIRKQTAEGGQVYIVCPAVEEVEVAPDEVSLEDPMGKAPAGPPLKAAVAYAKELQERLPELSVGFVHGKLKSTEKDNVMRRFADGDIQVLVSTTVIEVGVNVPNATLMIVENAERFGLSQLHQLRGRVGRGQRKSYCILVSDCEGGDAQKRLQTMCTTYDGYRIAEEDLALRGPGDFLRSGDSDVIRQSGGLRFRLAALCEDAELFAAASADAKALYASDPELEHHPALKHEVDRLFRSDAGTIS